MRVTACDICLSLLRQVRNPPLKPPVHMWEVTPALPTWSEDTVDLLGPKRWSCKQRSEESILAVRLGVATIFQNKTRWNGPCTIITSVILGPPFCVCSTILQVLATCGCVQNWPTCLQKCFEAMGSCILKLFGVLSVVWLSLGIRLAVSTQFFARQARCKKIIKHRTEEIALHAICYIGVSPIYGKELDIGVPYTRTGNNFPEQAGRAGTRLSS